MENVGKMLIWLGVGLVGIGSIFWLGAKFGLGKIPGDIAIERENFRFYFPITSSILISIILSLVFWLIGKIK